MIFRKFKIYQRRYLKYDLMAGSVVFLIAIPLCLGIALASGAPLFSGIIAGIIGGILVGAFSSSSISVSGPAAGMVAVVVAALTQLGSFNIFLLALFFAGIIQLLMGTFRFGFIADYIPSNVIQGLLCAIGILIILKQLPFAFTHMVDHQSLMNTLSVAAQNLDMHQLFSFLQKMDINEGALVIAVISVAILLTGDWVKNEKLKIIPAPVIVVVAGILLNEFYAYFYPSLLQDSAELVKIPVNGNLKEFFSIFQFPAWSSFDNPKVYFFAFFLAILASLETLLNLEATEKLDKRRKYCSRNRELVAQGIGNMSAGLIGGIPITSVIVRSSVNVQSGARTKFSTIVHGFFMLVAIALIPKWLNKIPLASLAVILIYVGYKLNAVSVYKNMYKQGLDRFIPFLITVCAIVFVNLFFGILAGLVVSFFVILKTNSKMRLDLVKETHPRGVVYRLMLPQHVSFLKKAALVAELNNLPKGLPLIIDARYSQFIDKDILELIKEFKEKQAVDKSIDLNLVGFKNAYEIHDHVNFVNVTTYDIQSALTPYEVLCILKEGNERFLKDQRIHRNMFADIRETAANQHPIGVVLSCIDSRVPVETIFDMGLGDLFSVRVGGNVINSDVIASIEFACSAGAKLILILGHTQCGAIKTACDTTDTNKFSEYLRNLIEKIQPAINSENKTTIQRNSNNEDFLLNVTEINVKNSIEVLCQKSELIRKLLEAKLINIIGAVYDVKSGMVHFQTDDKIINPPAKKEQVGLDQPALIPSNS